MSSNATISTCSTISSGLSFGAIYRMARRTKKAVRTAEKRTRWEKKVEEVKMDDEKVEKKRKMAPEEPIEAKKPRVEDLEEGEIFSSDEEDKENQSGPTSKIEYEDARELNDPNDDEEFFRKLKALYHGQRYILKLKK